jgi:polyisoprenoid-binding protein YceI
MSTTPTAPVDAPGTTATPGTVKVYTLDLTHSEVAFTVRHLVTNVRGRFNDYAATIRMDTANPEASSVEFRVKAASIDTANADRDTHLRSADFFDVEKYPEIVFRSTAIRPSIKGGDEEVYDVTGNLEMHGVTKEITLPVTYLGTARDPWGNDKAGFETTTKINRKDFDMVWNVALDAGGFILSEDIKIHINLETQLQK